MPTLRRPAPALRRHSHQLSTAQLPRRHTSQPRVRLAAATTTSADATSNPTKPCAVEVVTPSSCLSQAALNAAANDPSTCGSGKYVDAYAGASCPASTPWQYVCRTVEASTEYCCTHASSPTDGGEATKGCKVCPAQGCGSVLGASGAGVCFADSNQCPSSVNPSNPSEAVPRCPVMVSSEGHLPDACAQWCAANPAECNRAMTAYCSVPANVGLPACACIKPKGTNWGQLSFKDFMDVLRSNPKAQAQLENQAGAMDVRCAWPPCQVQGGGILKFAATDNDFKCPTIDNLCVNVIQDVHMKDVIAGTVTVGACIGKGNSPGGNNKTSHGVAELPFGTELWMWLQHNPLWLVLVATVLVLVFGGLAYVAFRPPTAVQLASAEMALARLQARHQAQEDALRTKMQASTNPTVKHAGEMLAQERAVLRKTQREALDTKKKEVEARMAAAQPMAASNAAAAMEVASLAVERDELQHAITTLA